MFAELSIQDVVFGVSPKSGYPVEYAYGYWAKNSVGDILDIIMQSLEVCYLNTLSTALINLFQALAFIHSHHIAHRVSLLLLHGCRFLLDLCRTPSRLIS